MEQRYIACMVLHALGDTIGYNNSEWEFKSGNLITRVNEKLFEFIDFGGINYVPDLGWRISDDTIMHIKIAEGLLSDFTTIDDLATTLVTKFIDALNQFDNEGLEKRHPGNTLIKSIDRLRDGQKWNQEAYHILSGGSGASMRSSCLGLAFFGKENRNTLIEIAIETSRITHNSAVGYLGGFVSALFTAFAIEGIDIKLWPFELKEIFKQERIERYIRDVGRDVDNFKHDKDVFIDKWFRYIDGKFDHDGNVIKRRTTKNLFWRITHYDNNYSFKRGDVVFPGSGGDDSVIIAYDCLVDAGPSWEKLVVYAMLHGGDTDTTGCIAASWYGALYGFGDVPLHRLDFLEQRKYLEQLGKDIFHKWFDDHRK